MKAVLFVPLLALLTGCAGMAIEVRGFTPEATARILAAFEAKKALCADGVAAERREARVETRPQYESAYERPLFPGRKPHVEARAVVHCK